MRNRVANSLHLELANDRCKNAGAKPPQNGGGHGESCPGAEGDRNGPMGRMGGRGKVAGACRVNVRISSLRVAESRGN
eukprot:749455-Prymnesium_polylepis.1